MNSYILSFLVTQNTTTTGDSTTMASTASDYLSSVPLTDEVETPSEVQRADGFESTSTSRSTNSPSNRDIDEPERMFSSGSALLMPRRRQLLASHAREILCLRSW
jgi:hypothetical protein